MYYFDYVVLVILENNKLKNYFRNSEREILSAFLEIASLGES